MTRIATFAMVVAVTALVLCIVASAPDRAAADYNVSGNWVFTYDTGTCTGTFTETKPIPFEGAFDLTLTLICPDSPVYVLVGTLDPANGGLGLIVQGGFYAGLRGFVSDGGHRIDGDTYSVFPAPQSFHFVATGGDGAPKLGTDTPLPSATPTPAPPPVGGLAFEAPASGAGGFDARWPIAIAVAFFVALGGATLYARRRFAPKGTAR